MVQVFSSEFCKVFKNTFFLLNASSGCFYILAINSNILIISLKYTKNSEEIEILKTIFSEKLF